MTAEWPPNTVLTVGHSNHPLPVFLDLLRRAEVQVIADVRSRPFASFSRHFDGEPLKQSLQAVGVRYVFLGGLGGKPSDDSLYDDEGHARYDWISATPAFLQAMDRLRTGIANYRVAMMCGEENPRGCHRHLMIARVLTDQGYRVRHLRAHGQWEGDEELVAEQPPLLFDEPLWRSAWKRKKGQPADAEPRE
jgi:uncharacterized protein (DUF488 family)